MNLFANYKSALGGDSITMQVATIIGEVLSMIQANPDSQTHYYKYVYTAAGMAPFVHIIYSYRGNDGAAYYLTCETGHIL